MQKFDMNWCLGSRAAHPLRLLALVGPLTWLACTSNELPHDELTTSTNASGGNAATGGQSASGGAASGGDNGGGGALVSSGGSGGETVDSAGGAEGSGGGPTNHEKKTYVYVGSGAFGGSEGRIIIYVYDRATYSLTRVDKIESGGLASSLAIDVEAGRLYAGEESRTGVRSFAIDRATGKLTDLGITESMGSPVYVTLSPNKDFLLAANYTQGNVDVYPISQEGKAEPSLATTPTGAHAHYIGINAQNQVMVANKGANTISLFTFDNGVLTPSSPPTVATESPRHIFRKDNKAYVVSENADLITAYTVESNGALSEDWTTTRLMGGDPNKDTGADIHVTPSGKYLYASNRGASNTLVAYDISSGMPTYLEHESTLGEIPRNFAVDPLEQAVIVGNQKSNTVVTFAIAADGGLDHKTTIDVGYPPFFIAIAIF